MMRDPLCVAAAICLLVLFLPANASEKLADGNGSEDYNPLAVQFNVSRNVTEEVPFLVNVLNPQTTHSCTGALIAPRVVLVPASCVSTPGSLSAVRANSSLMNKAPEEQQEVLTACKKILHPDFKGTAKEGNDVALIILAAPASTPKNILPKLMSMTKCPPGLIQMHGWFWATKQSGPSPMLEFVSVMKHAPEACEEHFRKQSPAPICMKTDITQQLAWDLGALLTCNATAVIGMATGTVPDMPTSKDDVVYVHTSAQDYHDWIQRWIQGGGDDKSAAYVNSADECEAFVIGGSKGLESCKTYSDGRGWCKVNADGAGTCMAGADDGVCGAAVAGVR